MYDFKEAFATKVDTKLKLSISQQVIFNILQKLKKNFILLYKEREKGYLYSYVFNTRNTDLCTYFSSERGILKTNLNLFHVSLLKILKALYAHYYRVLIKNKIS